MLHPCVICNNRDSSSLLSVPEHYVVKIRQIYRRIAKKLHPDLNPLTEEHEELMELWRRNVTAYNCNDLKELEEIEVLVDKALKDLGQGKTEISIPDIDFKIERLYAEIEKIKTTDLASKHKYCGTHILFRPLGEECIKAVAELTKLDINIIRTLPDFCCAVMGAIYSEHSKRNIQLESAVIGETYRPPYVGNYDKNE